MVIDKFCADGKDTPAFGSFQSMFNYYDACENGLARADSGLKAQPQRSFFSWRYVGYEPISLRVLPRFNLVSISVGADDARVVFWSRSEGRQRTPATYRQPRTRLVSPTNTMAPPGCARKIVVREPV